MMPPNSFSSECQDLHQADCRSKAAQAIPAGQKIRLGIAGCGRAFERLHLPALKRLQEFELVAACDLSEERRRWLGRVLPDLCICDSLETLFDSGPIEAVLIATPPECHCQDSLQALEKGAHVMVEKPMALNAIDGLRMVDTALKKRRILWVGFQRRFRQTLARLKREIALAGADSVSSMTYDLFLSPLGWGSVTGFLGDDQRGGGILDDVFSHQVNVIPWLFDSRVALVRARPPAKTAWAEDCLAVDVLLKNGLGVQCLAGHGKQYRERLSVQFNDHCLTVFPCLVIRTGRGQKRWAAAYAQLRGHGHHLWHRVRKTPNLTLESAINQLRAFASAIRGTSNRSRGSDGKEGLEEIRAIEACRRSCKDGGTWQPVKETAGA